MTIIALNILLGAITILQAKKEYSGQELTVTEAIIDYFLRTAKFGLDLFIAYTFYY